MHPSASEASPGYSPGAQAAVRADYAGRRRITAAGFTRCARKQYFDEIGFTDIALERRDLDRLRTVGQKRGERFGPIPRIVQEFQDIHYFAKHSLSPLCFSPCARNRTRSERMVPKVFEERCLVA